MCLQHPKNVIVSNQFSKSYLNWHFQKGFSVSTYYFLHGRSNFMNNFQFTSYIPHQASENLISFVFKVQSDQLLQTREENWI